MLKACQGELAYWERALWKERCECEEVSAREGEPREEKKKKKTDEKPMICSTERST